MSNTASSNNKDSIVKENSNNNEAAKRKMNAENTREEFKKLESRAVVRLHPIADRIVQAMEYKSHITGTKLTWNGLAQSLLLSPGAPTNWKKGKISKETLERIANFTGVEFSWLVTGEGEMTKELNDVRKSLGWASSVGIGGLAGGGVAAGGMLTGASLATPMLAVTGPLGIAAGVIAATAFKVIGDRISNTKLQKVLNELENEEPDLVEEIRHDVEEAVEKQLNENIQKTTESGIRLVPLISFVQAGTFKEAILNAQDQFVATYAGNLGGYAFALEIVGDSMLPDFKPKDKIICDPDVTPIPGDFVIAQNGEAEATFKKYKPRGYDETGKEYFELVALNDDYPTLDSRFQDIQIIATVIDHIRSLRR